MTHFLLLQICPCNAWIVVSRDFVAVVLSDFTFTVIEIGFYFTVKCCAREWKKPPL